MEGGMEPNIPARIFIHPPYIDENRNFITQPVQTRKEVLPMNKWIQMILILLLAVTFVSCNNQEERTANKPLSQFNPEILKIPDGGRQKMRGQVLYMPVYSNLPYREGHNYKLSNFLAIHNTDLVHPIKITKAVFFNTEGQEVKHFFSENLVLNPLETRIVPVLQKDQSGTGDCFLVEWMADQPVNEPLIESVMKDLSGNLGMSFLSTGRVIREIQ